MIKEQPVIYYTQEPICVKNDEEYKKYAAYIQTFSWSDRLGQEGDAELYRIHVLPSKYDAFMTAARKVGVVVYTDREMKERVR